MSEDTAMQRFIVLNTVRLTGVAMVLIGVLVIEGVVDLPDIVGYVFIPFGLFEVFFMPFILARHWKSRSE